MSSVNGFLLAEERFASKILGPSIKLILITHILNGFLGIIIFFPQPHSLTEGRVYCMKHVLRPFIRLK